MGRAGGRGDDHPDLQQGKTKRENKDRKDTGYYLPKYTFHAKVLELRQNSMILAKIMFILHKTKENLESLEL